MKSKTCPMCKKYNRFEEPQKIVYKCMDDLELICQGPNGNGVCKLEGKPIKYLELVGKHGRECSGSDIVCPLGCGFIIKDEDILEEHIKDLCPNSLVQCADCDLVLTRKNTTNHDCYEYLLREIQHYEKRHKEIDEQNNAQKIKNEKQK